MAITTHRIKFRRARKIAAAALATATAAEAAAEMYLRLISLLGCSLDCLLPYGCFLCGPQQIYISFAMVAAPSPTLPPPTPVAAHQAWPDDDFGKVYEALSIVGIVGIARISTDCEVAAPLLLLPQSTSTGVAF